MEITESLEQTMTRELEELKAHKLAPEWMTVHGYSMLKGGYFLPGESPRDMYLRISSSAANKLLGQGYSEDLTQTFFDLFWNNLLCPASPVAANLGTDRGLPISCFGLYAPDSIEGIGDTVNEMRTLSKHGGGIGIYWGDLRPRGTGIKVDSNGNAQNGESKGPMPFIKEQDTSTHTVDQGSTRKGNSVAYLDIDHPDIKEFIRSRKKIGDHRNLCENIHHGVTVPDSFMERIYQGDEEASELFLTILKMRKETGEPFISFTDNANKHRPIAYVKNELYIKAPQLCTEIFLYMDEDHTYVCCLSSLNLVNYDLMLEKNAAYYGTIFLDAVMQEFIDKIKIKMETTPYSHHWRRVYNFATKSRALGLGVLGWHSLLQSRSLAFDSFESMMLNNQVFSHIQKECYRASRDLAKVLGEPEWCEGTGMRNTHTNAIAPTRSNSMISGGHGKGIEPEKGNYVSENAAKLTANKKNVYLEKLLEEKGKNTPEVWNNIANHSGSVQQLDFLTEHEKDVFKTAYEINQFAIVKQASVRQKYIDQGQSLNLFFDENASADYIMQVHLAAHLAGLKSLYYLYTESVISADTNNYDVSECASCEG